MVELTTQEINRINAFSKRELGAWGEAKAAEYLVSFGMKILDRNWHCRFGEIDLIAYVPEERAILAIEVKTRRTVQAGMPEEAITSKKLKRLRMLIVEWVGTHQDECYALGWQELQVQAIAIDVRTSTGSYRLRHLREL